MKNIFQHRLAHLFYVFSASVLLSQSLMDLFATAIGVIFFGGLFLGKIKLKEAFPSTGFDWLWPLWIFIVGLGYVINARESLQWQQYISEFRWILLMYFCARILYLIKPNWESFRKLLPVILFVSLYGLFSFMVGYDYLFSRSSARIGGTFGNPMTFAHLFSVVLVVLLGFLFLQLAEGKKKDWLLIVTVFLAAITLVLTLTRGAWMSVVFGVVLMSFVYKPKMGYRIALLFSLILPILYMMWPTFKNRVDHSLNYQNNYDSYRVVLWQTNVEMIKDYPILGMGYGENKTRLREYYDRLGVPPNQFESHAHNQFLHLWAGTGILGLSCYILCFVFFIRLAYQLYHKFSTDDWRKGLALGILGAQSGFLIGGLTESNFEHGKVKYILVLIWSVLIWLRNDILLKRLDPTSK